MVRVVAFKSALPLRGYNDGWMAQLPCDRGVHNGLMGPRPQDDSDAEIKDRPRCGQGESRLATTHCEALLATYCEALLDHHIEELLTAFDELAGRYG